MIHVTKRFARLILFLFTFAVLFSCSGEKDLSVEVRVSLDGKPAPGAQVQVDGVGMGATQDNGILVVSTKKKPGTKFTVSVTKEAPGYKIEPWEKSFVMELPEQGKPLQMTVDAELKAIKFFTISVKEDGTPISGAEVTVDGKKAAETDENGQSVYEYEVIPEAPVKVEVFKAGYAGWTDTVEATPGKTLEATLSKEAVLNIRAVTEDLGGETGLEGVAVYIDKKKVGTTNSKGAFRYIYNGEPGKTVKVSLSTTDNFFPSGWSSNVELFGQKTLKRYFYSTKERPIRVGIYGYASNVSDADISDNLRRMEEALGNNLFSNLVFQEVKSETLKSEMKRTKSNLETMTTKGWENSPLAQSVDAVIIGSIGKSDKRLLVETKVYASSGQLVLSQINQIRDERDIKKLASRTADDIVRYYPFRGMLVSKQDDQFQINIGSSGYNLKRGMEFALLAPETNKSGKRTKYKDIGTLRLKSVSKGSSLADAVEIQKDQGPKVGYIAARRILAEEEKKAAKDSFILLAKGGVPPDVDALRGVNIYLNDSWVGTTGPDGKAEIPVKLKKKYDIVLYRHGYQSITDKVQATSDKEVKEFTLEVNSSTLEIESEPSRADLFIDGTFVGKTPITKGVPVNFGFHTVSLTVPGDYRAWEEVVEFNKKVTDFTGSNKVVFVKDFMAIAKRAEESGDIDAAITAYASADSTHPDYSDAHYRLAQLYMDDKNDYAAAVQEFENVLSRPENQQLIYKQYAVAYTNLGHAYYALGNEQVRSDSNAAAQNFANAIGKLEKAKQNTRFFPSEHYDEAVHDTYYYLALSYHKLYLVTKKEALLEKADFAWREYFDFFPRELEGKADFAEMKDSAQKYWTQVKDLM